MSRRTSWSCCTAGYTPSARIATRRLSRAAPQASRCQRAAGRDASQATATSAPATPVRTIEGRTSTENLRQAVISYRALFEEMLVDEPSNN